MLLHYMDISFDFRARTPLINLCPQQLLITHLNPYFENPHTQTCTFTPSGSRLQHRLACEWLEYLHCVGTQVAGQQEYVSSTRPGVYFTSVTHTHSLWHSHIHCLSNPHAILLPLECQLIRLCNTLKDSLKSNALSLSLPLLLLTCFTASRHLTVSFHSSAVFLCQSCRYPSAVSLRISLLNSFYCSSWLSVQLLFYPTFSVNTATMEV